MKLASLVAACLALTISTSVSAWAKPPIEAFGDVSVVRSAELSPDGKRMAFLQRANGVDYLTLHDFETKKTESLVAVSDLKARNVSFAGDNYIILTASETTRKMGFSGKFENSAAFAYSIATGKTAQLLSNTAGIYPAQGGLGQIVAVDPSGKYVYMPAWMGTGSNDATRDVLKVSLETGRGAGQVATRGSPWTRDWIVTTKGEPLVREEYTEQRLEYQLRIYKDAESRVGFIEPTDLPTRSIVGTSSDASLIYMTAYNEGGFLSLYSMVAADGAVAGPLVKRSDADIDRVIVDENRVVRGVAFSGMLPTYEMFDPNLNADLAAISAAFPGSAVHLDSWSTDWSRVLLHVEGGALTPRYVLFDRAARKTTVVSQMRPQIKAQDIGETITIEYPARDGLKIPALITWPVGVAEADRKNLPFIIMPHGGPEDYDAVGFDWLAQYLANEGYAILQPNFRGSYGFGADFRDAGRGQWGRKMQDDITDGVNALNKMGWANSQRICIVGWSYGGYAALAGGALTPDAYKCVASIAGVSDLKQMLKTEERNFGSRSLVYHFWSELIGDPDRNGAEIDAVSPVRLAANFKAPVLLVHGADDLVVDVAQSNQMESALKAKGKDVTYLRIKGDDHSLVGDSSRNAMLEALTAFLAKHIGKPQ